MEVFNELLEYLSTKEELVNEEISIESSIAGNNYIELNGKRLPTTSEENLILDKERLFERVYKELVKELKRREEK